MIEVRHTDFDGDLPRFARESILWGRKSGTMLAQMRAVERPTTVDDARAKLEIAWVEGHVLGTDLAVQWGIPGVRGAPSLSVSRLPKSGIGSPNEGAIVQSLCAPLGLESPALEERLRTVAGLAEQGLTTRVIVTDLPGP